MESSQRDTSRDGFHNKLEFYALTHFKPLWSIIQSFDSLKKRVNGTLINRQIYKIKTRPYPFSTKADYTSWESLTDRSYSARHLPPVSRDPATLPPIDDVVKLFARKPGQTKFSSKSTLLFSHFAQWFTDAFLRTDRSNYLKNTSNHDLDLCTVYGLTPRVTNLIRSHTGGKLKSQQINGEEYPCYYFDEHGEVKSEYTELTTIFPEHLEPERRGKLFAMGGDRANVQVGYVMLNTLFLREHNRICDVLARRYPAWDDERLFQTARNILIVLLIKIVVEEYINHIAPYHFKFTFDTSGFGNERWHRQNWMSVEFSLVYRWHSMVPDHVTVAGEELPADQTFFNSDMLTCRGLGALFEETSQQPAGEIGLFNTPSFLLDVERASILTDRKCQLASYNDYREMCKFPRATDFDQISSDPEIQQALKALYGHVDNLEFYVGLYAEDTRVKSAVGPLIGRLVGIDAFSQALTTPLLGEHIYNEQTFSQAGLEIIDATSTLSDLLHRNIPETGKRYKVSMTLDRPG
jgi:prostaglandin-endoperoxide synthase 2